MNLRNERSSAPDLGRLGLIPRDAEGPVFNAPWEAQAFAMAVKLCEAGHFTWPEWVDAFSEQLKRYEAQGVYEPATDDGHHYYEVWLSTLEGLIFAKGMLGKPAVEARRQHLNENPVPHDHHARREPVCIA